MYLPKITKNIIIINVAVFLLTRLGESVFRTQVMYATFSMYPLSQSFHWWQPLTYMFMHGGFFHIFFNMYTLFIFGPVLENMIGGRKFLRFYLLCGIFAAALHVFVQYLTGSTDAPMVGASGAIYGVLIGYAMLFPESRLTLLFPPVTLSAKWMVVIFAVIELLTGVTGTVEGVAHFAHLGGMIMGWFLIFIWRRKGTLFNRE